MSNGYVTEKEQAMKRALIYSLLAALLGGCVVVPYGYRDHDDGYHNRGYYRGDGYYHRDSYPGYYGNYDYGPRYGYGSGGFRYNDHGG
jgi:hypothetical protein